MKEIVADKSLIAYCGLYCGACRKYLSGKCAGCAGNAKASWCKVRQCGIDNRRASCAECTAYADVNACGWFNSIIARMFGLIFRSDRRACIRMIREKGYGDYAGYMAANRIMTIRKK